MAEIPDLIYPRYINKDRLIDIYSLMNNGILVTQRISNNKSTSATDQTDSNVSGGLGNIIKGKIGNSSSSIEDESTNIETITTQTPAQILLSVLRNNAVEKKDVIDLTYGEMAVIDVNFTLNSLDPLLEIITPILELTKSSNEQNKNKNSKQNHQNINNTLSTAKSIKTLFQGQKLLQETDDYAISCNFDKNNLYLSTIDEIINVNLKCLCIVKKINNEGCRIHKSSIMSIASQTLLDSFTESIKTLAEDDSIEINYTLSIKNKKVYELEIIALY